MSRDELDRTAAAVEATEAAMAKPAPGGGGVVCTECGTSCAEFAVTEGARFFECPRCGNKLEQTFAIPATITVTMTVLEAAAFVGEFGNRNVKDAEALAVRQRIHSAYLAALVVEDEASR